MNKFQKFVAGAAAIGTGLLATVGHAFGAIIGVPTYSDVVSTSGTAFATSFVADILPWLAIFVGLVIGALLIGKLRRAIVGFVKGIFGGARRRMSRRGRR